MSDAAKILPPLLRALTVLEFIARHLDPMTFDEMFAAVGTPDAALREALQGHEADDAPPAASARLALAAFDAMRTASAKGDDLYAIFGALRYLPRALEALYPLASRDPVVNGFFLDPSLRVDADAATRAMQPPREGETGVIHVDNERGSRGGYSLYVPEGYSPGRPLSLVMALHGGSGHGRAFLWSWLRDARSFDAIVVAPTATGRTWALAGDDADTPNLHRILDAIAARWPVDPARLLLTGMSDGGTFCYVSGLEAGSRFTHLAPVSATFHPMLTALADAERLEGLPIHITHGARDWMFPVEVARRAGAALAAAGASVTYAEIDDLSHCYPREINAALLTWLRDSPR
ncbi:MAG: phospholipase [Xanthobacteraceae bacterium]|nr:phospholipase [Xanthobacteraceae bacterium]